MRVLGAWSYLVCDGLWISYAPLAMLERDGYACWLWQHTYEDGVSYVLQQPGVPDDTSGARCFIR